MQDKISQVRKSRNAKIAEINSRSGLFGYTKPVGGLFGDADRGEISESEIRSSLKPFDNQIADLERQIEAIEKGRADAVEVAGRQVAIDDIQPEAPPKSAGEKLERMLAEGGETQNIVTPLSEIDNVSDLDGIEMSAKEEAEGLEQAEKLQDFGQKIGMARKDIAESGFTRSGNTESERQPAWKSKYKVIKQENFVIVERLGSFRNREPLDPNKYTLSIISGRQFRDLKTNINTVS